MRDTGIAVPLIGTSRTSTRGFFGERWGSSPGMGPETMGKPSRSGEEKGKQDGSLDLCVNLNWVEWHSGEEELRGRNRLSIYLFIDRLID